MNARIVPSVLLCLCISVGAGSAPAPAGKRIGPADKLYGQALGLHRDGRIPEAIEVLERLVERHARHTAAPLAQFLLGLWYRETGDTDKALQAFRNVAQRFPKSEKVVEARLAIGDMLLSDGDVQGAASAFHEAASTHPRGARQTVAMYQYGYCVESTDGPAEAASVYHQVLSDFPRDNDASGRAAFRLGCCQESLGEWEEAESAQRDFLRQFPGHPLKPQALLKLGFAQEMQGKLGQARENYEAAVSATGCPRDVKALALLRLGGCYLRMDRAIEATAALRRARECQEEIASTPEFMVLQGSAYLGAGKADEAAVLFREIIEHHPDCQFVGDAKLKLARASELRGDHEAAITGYRKLLDGAPAKRRPEIGLCLASCHEAQREWADALEAATSALAAGAEGACAMELRTKIAFYLRMLGRYDEATAAYEAALASVGGSGASPRLELGLAEVLEAKGQTEEAAGAYERLQSSEDATVKADASVKLAAIEVRANRIAAARKVLERTLVESPTAPSAPAARALLGYVLLRAGERDRGIALLAEAAKEVQPQSAMARRARIALGDACMDTGDQVGAREHFEAAIKGGGDGTLADTARLKLAHVAADEGNYEEALMLLATVEAGEGPNAALASYTLGYVHELSGNPDLAMVQYQQVLAQQGDDPEVAPKALLRMACIFEKKRRVKDLAAQARQLIDKFPNAPEALVARQKLSFAYELAGEYGKALEEAQALLDRSPADPDLVAITKLQMGSCYRKAGDLQKALAMYDEVEREYAGSPRGAEAKLYRGFTYYHERDFEASAKQMRRALNDEKLSETHRENCYFSLARSHELAGDYDEAIQTYEEVIERYPGGTHTAQAQFQIGVCYHARQQNQKAAEAFTRAAEMADGTPLALSAKQWATKLSPR